MKEESKETLLKEIEALIAYGNEEPTIDPALLNYLDLPSLRAIRDRLHKKHSTLTEEDKVWLRNFRKED